MLTAEQRESVLTAHKLGHSYRGIAKVVGCHHSTVSAVVSGPSTPKNPPKRRGRPPLLSSPARQRLKDFAVDGRRTFTANELRAAWEEAQGQLVSEKTIRRALHKAGLYSRVARRKPFISEVNKAKRLAWCLEHEHWTVRKWRSVFFTDEKSFTQFETKAHKRVWRTPNEEFASDCLVPTVSRSQSCMVWGGFSWKERAPLFIHSGSVTGAVHATLLESHAIPSFKSIFPRGGAIFQQDNAPVHTSKIARRALSAKKVKTLPWPAYSPDLNPIENLWAIMETNLRSQYSPSSLEELRKAVRSVWNSIPQEVLHDLIDSMPRRVNAVIEARGGATSY